jgi:hypothetical protein
MRIEIISVVSIAAPGRRGVVPHHPRAGHVEHVEVLTLSESEPLHLEVDSPPLDLAPS